VIGCADPGARFGEFQDRVIDGSVTTIDASELDEIPDVTGVFLLGADPAPFPGSVLRFKATTTLTKTAESVTIQLDIQPLHRMTGEPVGDPILMTPRQAAVSITGEFEARAQGVVPGEANAISGTPATLDLMMSGIIRNNDYDCGILNGAVVAPLQLDLDGSTFGSIRIPEGASINDLTPIAKCIDLDAPDAGVPDAMPPDATPPDATPPDADVADADVPDAT
jgi:hypothetical protein